MKSLILTASSTLLMTLAMSAMAERNSGAEIDATIMVVDTAIAQIQDGGDLEQVALIGAVDSESAGSADVTIKTSVIVQAQGGGNNEQEAVIGSVVID